AIEEAVLMFAHFERFGGFVEVERLWNSCAPGLADPNWLAADRRRIDEFYRPVIVDLTNEEARAAGMYVCSAWSARAIDFPHPGSALGWAGGPQSTEAWARFEVE